MRVWRAATAPVHVMDKHAKHVDSHQRLGSYLHEHWSDREDGTFDAHNMQVATAGKTWRRAGTHDVLRLSWKGGFSVPMRYTVGACTAITMPAPQGLLKGSSRRGSNMTATR